MPSRQRVLSAEEARRFVGHRGFETGGAAPLGRRVGIELEWLAVSLEDPARPANFETVLRACSRATPFPGGSSLSFEPGGQVELSTQPLPLFEACAALARDAEVLGAALARDGVALVGLGLEPGPQRARAVFDPRYDAMEAYFDAAGAAGRTMMRSSAAIQVNLDLGERHDVQARWQTLHDIGPVLTAAFANSPFAGGAPSGWRSTRLAVWARIDPPRTEPVAGGGDVRSAWAGYALDAGVMLVRRSEHDFVPVLSGLTFQGWIEHGHALGWPDRDDLDYHLTTLFPPVRPRGRLELRTIDALPSPWAQAAAAVVAVLVDDAEAARHAREASRATRGMWPEAARHGLRHPVLGAAARACFGAALEALARVPASVELLAAAEAFVDRYVSRGRCPADDLLDAWAARGAMLPTPDNAGGLVWT